MIPTLIVAFGNPLRSDDGLGPAVAEALRLQQLGPHVEVVDGGTASLTTVLTFEGRSRIIIVDAADLGQAPGTVRQWQIFARDLETHSIHPNSLHAAGLMDALALAAALGALPEQITFYGVQPLSLEYEIGLSAAVRSAVPAVVQSIVASLNEF